MQVPIAEGLLAAAVSGANDRYAGGTVSGRCNGSLNCCRCGLFMRRFRNSTQAPDCQISHQLARTEGSSDTTTTVRIVRIAVTPECDDS